MSRAASSWKKITHFFQREIWRQEHLHDRTPRGLLYSALRVATLTLTGLHENKATSRAAALSFSSLLGLGPLVVITVLIAGFVVQGDPGRAEAALDKLMHRIVPQLGQYDRLPPAGQPANPAVASPPPAAKPELAQLISGFVAGSRSGAAGVLGALTLIVIVLQLFSSVENAFNEIWGVRRGRSLLRRIVLYWTVLTLGAVLFFAAVTGISAGAFFNALATRLDLGPATLNFLRLLLPSASVVVLLALLTLFYRFIPNTKVRWGAAFLGAAVVAALLVLNNLLAFLYVQRVAMQTTLYGSLGLLPVLMAGLYVFWLFILVGGQLSYAAQNVHFRNSRAVWSGLSESLRERLSLLVLLTIARRFQACLPPCNAAQLSSMIKVPAQILNECLNRLVQMGLVTPVPPSAGDGAADFLYQPARPLGRITLGEFKRLDDDLGDDTSSPVLVVLDPLLQLYDDTLAHVSQGAFFKKSLDQLLTEVPIDASRPPFAFGQRVKSEE
ncbi:MAG: YihY/virulence factor BrkB family protein [Verrucomicrobiota bacterium]